MKKFWYIADVLSKCVCRTIYSRFFLEGDFQKIPEEEIDLGIREDTGSLGGI